MSKYYHIALGDSAKGNIAAFFNIYKDNIYSGEVRNFRDDLSTGCINNIDHDLRVRAEWIYKLNSVTGYYDYKDVDSSLKDVESIYNSEMDFPNGAKIIIWHGENIKDRVALLYLVSRLKKYTLFEVNVSKNTDGILKDYDKIYSIRAVGECRSDELDKALVAISEIDTTKKDSFDNEWNNVSNSLSTLRILEDDKVLNVDEDYYDPYILNNIRNHYQYAAKVIGITMSSTDQLVGDAFIDYRLRNLIKNGEVQYKGRLRFMREYEVKLKEE